MPKLPLQGIRVSEFGVVWAGRDCAAFLAGVGAENTQGAVLEHVGNVTAGKWEPRKDFRAILSIGGVLSGYASVLSRAGTAAGVL